MFEVGFGLSFPENPFMIKLRLLGGQFDALIFAILALAKSRASDARVEALAVVLYAGGFRAGAAPRVEQSFAALEALVLVPESVGVFLDGQLQGLGPRLRLLARVLAPPALAVRPADPSLGEALAVQPEASTGLAATGRVPRGRLPHPLEPRRSRSPRNRLGGLEERLGQAGSRRGGLLDRGVGAKKGALPQLE